jgi:hypothetical protein
MSRANTNGSTALPSFRVVGISVVNFTALPVLGVGVHTDELCKH